MIKIHWFFNLDFEKAIFYSVLTASEESNGFFLSEDLRG